MRHLQPKAIHLLHKPFSDNLREPGPIPSVPGPIDRQAVYERFKTRISQLLIQGGERTALESKACSIM